MVKNNNIYLELLIMDELLFLDSFLATRRIWSVIKEGLYSAEHPTLYTAAYLLDDTVNAESYSE